MLNVRRISKYYQRGERAALADVSVEVNDGEFMVLLGPSGSGKTTLLRAIAGLETIDDGEIVLDGRVMNHVSPRERNMAMVFQDYALYPHMRVADNIAYNMRLRKLGRAEIDQRVREAARMLDIEPLLRRKPAALSGGERQRVAVARAITRDAAVLLMDEPLSNLDAQIREHVRIELRELQKRLNVTTVYVTHDQVEAMVMADRVAVLRLGQVQQIGTPAEIYGRPSNLFCAQFIGSPRINEIAGEARTYGSALQWRAASTTLNLVSEEPTSTLNEHWRPCVLAFRAEDAHVANSGIPVVPQLVENRGAERYLVVRPSAELESAQRSAELRIRIGDPPQSDASVAFLPWRAYIFDPEKGQRLAIASCEGVRHAGPQEVVRA